MQDPLLPVPPQHVRLHPAHHAHERLQDAGGAVATEDGSHQWSENSEEGAGGGVGAGHDRLHPSDHLQKGGEEEEWQQSGVRFIPRRRRPIQNANGGDKNIL